jgi:very-long-chain enoyl-CoA reductase
LEYLTAPKKPIRKLPPAISVSTDTTVEEVKKLIAKTTGIKDFNRVGLFYPSTKKTLKDRLARIGDEKDVVDAGEMLVKDLGKLLTLHLLQLCASLGVLGKTLLEITLKLILASMERQVLNSAGASST